MKPLLKIILLVGILFRYHQQTAFAGALTAIMDIGKEMVKTVFPHPLNTITDMGKGSTSRYEPRSFSSSTRSLKKESILPAKDAERYLKHEQEIRDDIIEKLRKEKDRRSKLALRSIPEITDFLVYWRGIAKSGFWFYRMYAARNANKKLTKAEEARKQEYFCGDNDTDTLTEYCTKALNENTAFFDEKGWRYDTTKSPKCELKNIILDKYDYISQRGVLTCPIVIKREGESDEHTSAYISSIDDPPKNRLAYYVFTDTEEDIDRYAQKLAQPEKQSSIKSDKNGKDNSRINIGFKTFLPAISALRATKKSDIGLTKSLLLPASTSAIKAIRNMDGNIKSYLPFGSAKKTPELPPGKPLKVISLVVNKKST